jgi:hypothetical protein
MAVGFIVAVGVYHVLRRWGRDKKYIGWMVRTENK